MPTPDQAPPIPTDPDFDVYEFVTRCVDFYQRRNEQAWSGILAGYGDWKVNETWTRITFSRPDGSSLRLSVHTVGSLSTRTGTWRWLWANPNWTGGGAG